MTNMISDLNLLTSGAGPGQCFPLYRYTSDGEKISNITPAYREKFGTCTDEQLFNYIYAVLHHPMYRQTYKIDLSQNLPAVPVSPHFAQLSALGQQLGQLHTHFDTASPFAFTRTDKDILSPQPKLKSYPAKGTIVIDESTTLSGIPSMAWQYTLGNRSAIDWVLEGYKAKKPKTEDGDIAVPTSPLYQDYGYVAYSFATYKEQCIADIARVVSVAVETLNLIEKIGECPLTI